MKRNDKDKFLQKIERVRNAALKQLQEMAALYKLQVKDDLRYRTTIELVHWYCNDAKEFSRERSLGMFVGLISNLRRIIASLPVVVLEDYYST
ncbi:MAG: hypothetical protein RLZZ517_163 [Candidatus Parcubacteria bacterium]|jgi:hypothetical protein